MRERSSGCFDRNGHMYPNHLFKVFVLNLSPPYSFSLSDFAHDSRPRNQVQLGSPGMRRGGYKANKQPLEFWFFPYHQSRAFKGFVEGFAKEGFPSFASPSNVLTLSCFALPDRKLQWGNLWSSPAMAHERHRWRLPCSHFQGPSTELQRSAPSSCPTGFGAFSPPMRMHIGDDIGPIMSLLGVKGQASWPLTSPSPEAGTAVGTWSLGWIEQSKEDYVSFPTFPCGLAFIQVRTSEWRNV